MGDLTKCHDWGGPRYRHVPPAEMRPTEALQARETLRNTASTMAIQMEEFKKIEKQEQRDYAAQKADVSISNMAAWFAKYGEPRRGSGPTFERQPNRDGQKLVDPERVRQAELAERQRSVPHKPRHVPHVGKTNAQPLRLGS